MTKLENNQIDAALKFAAEAFGLSDWRKLLARDRTRWLAEIRFVAYYAASKNGASRHDIANRLGYHVTNVRYGIEKVEDLLSVDAQFAEKVKTVERRLSKWQKNRALEY